MSITKAVTTIFVLTLLWSSTSFAATGDVNGDGKIGLEEAIYPAFIRLELIFTTAVIEGKIYTMGGSTNDNPYQDTVEVSEIFLDY